MTFFARGLARREEILPNGNAPNPKHMGIPNTGGNRLTRRLDLLKIRFLWRNEAPESMRYNTGGTTPRRGFLRVLTATFLSRYRWNGTVALPRSVD